ncbi:type VI secretion system lipoprotein TssJ [Undibacterium sp. RuRC25W]|uniref:type VI secretion system lipoprotein TssJ n=1 Tax=Undibacterium sp. RuRC25W TaxID=3413047 RepID=UPI003BF21CE3
MSDTLLRIGERFSSCFLKCLTAMICSLFTLSSLAQQDKESTKLALTISADANVNPDSVQHAAPIKVRIYELKDSATFADADYFTLDNNEKITLVSDLLAKDEYILRPSEVQKIERKSNPQTTAIGILAGYRDLPNSIWRVVYKLPPAPEVGWFRFAIPANKSTLRIQLQAQGIVIIEDK